MNARRSHRSGSRRGLATASALVFLLVFTSLAVAVCLLANTGLAQSQNHKKIQAAQMQAESGLSYLRYVLTDSVLPLAGVGQDILDALAEDLAGRLDGTGTLQCAATSYDGTKITIPEVILRDTERGFRGELWMADPQTVRLRVIGRAGTVERALQADFGLVGGHPIFGFGISSKGPIALEGNIKVLGENNPSEARLLSTAPGTAFRLQGDLEVQGDVYATDPAAEVDVNGTGTIGGASMTDPNVQDHIHIGEGFPNFPEINTAQFVPFATSIVDGSTGTSGPKTFNNIRIKAGTNPTFQGNVNLNGVIYVEAPNRVTFAEGTTITGVIVTEDAGQPSPDNLLKFECGTYSYGVEELPDNEMFHDLRTMTGSFILAPSFSVKFENESGVINGIIAADKVKFENAFNGTLRGGILCYGEDEFKAENYSSFTIDHAKYNSVPAGFTVERRKLVLNPDSYTED